MSETITLTEGQQSAYEAFNNFILDPDQQVFVIQGYSGTGKTTLIQTIMDRISKILKTVKLLDPHNAPEWAIELTATTNQAADQFAQITGQPVATIHSKLGLRVHRDYETGKTKLVTRGGVDKVRNTILFVDEASYIDQALLRLIFKQTEHCKIVFIGDPAQLLNVGCTRSPVFDANFPTAQLTQVVRQAEGNPIIDLSTKFRHTVNSGEFFSFTPDRHHIQYLDRDAFEDEILKEFNRPDWSHHCSKVLAWTNKTVVNYNNAIRNHVKGEPELKEGDFAVVNSYIRAGKQSFKTDQVVYISRKREKEENNGVNGHWYELDKKAMVFCPDSLVTKKARLKQARADGEMELVRIIEDEWADLRAAYACTINKSQGSTYDKVFIDLDDVKKCNSGNQIARMLYVAVSRARHNVYLTGDLV